MAPMRAHPALCACLALALVALAPLALAQEADEDEGAPPEAAEEALAAEGEPTDALPNNRWTLRGLAFISAGPFKATGLLGVHYRHIYHRDDSIILDKANVTTGFEVYVNPSTPGAQLWVEWQPLAILKLRLAYDAIATTGLAMGYGYGLRFPSTSAPYDGDTLKARKGEEELGLSHRLSIRPTVQAKAGPIVLVNELELGAWFVHGEKGEGWYDIFYDTLIKRGEIDGVIANRTILAGEVWTDTGEARLLVGAVNQVVHTMSTETLRNRLGGFVAFTPVDQIWGIARPTFLLMPGVALLDPNRKYEFYLEGLISLSWDFDEF